MNWLRNFVIVRIFNSVIERGIELLDKALQKLPGQGARTFLGAVLAALGLALQNFTALCPLLGEVCALAAPFAPQIQIVGGALLTLGGIYAPAGFVAKLLEYKRSAEAEAAGKKTVDFNAANKIAS